MTAPRETNIRIRAAQPLDRRNQGRLNSAPSAHRTILTLGPKAGTSGCRQTTSPLRMFGRGPGN
jgi:hypothetical protein